MPKCIIKRKAGIEPIRDRKRVESMDTKQIEYILKIAEEGNITHAAEKLYLTQPALNQQLLRLEKELGTLLFVRSRTHWHPTDAGKVYLENARKILQLKQDTYRIINDMVSCGKGRLSVGFTPGRGINMFSDVYPRFHQTFPGITVTPHELSVHRQQALIARGELDIGFMTLCEKHKTRNEYIPICQEEIYLAIPSRHPLSNPAPEDKDAIMDITAVQYEPFVLMYKESTIRSLVDEVFEQAGFQPDVLFETSNTVTILTMIQSNLCCGLIPEYYIRNCPAGITCFRLPSRPCWEIAACYRKGSYLTQAAKYFIELTKEHWNS